MSKLTDMIISAVIKKGVLYEMRNVDTNVEIPILVGESEKKIAVSIKAEHVTLRIEKDGTEA